MLRRRILRQLMLAATLVLATVPGQTRDLNDYEKRRVQDGAKAVAAIDAQRADIGGTSFLLLMFNSELSDGDLDAAVPGRGVIVTAVYLCSPGGGVLAELFEPGRPWSDPANRHSVGDHLEELDRVAKIVSRASPISDTSNRQQPPRGYCGIDVQGSWQPLRELRQRLRQRIGAEEITSARMRMMPLNLLGVQR